MSRLVQSHELLPIAASQAFVFAVVLVGQRADSSPEPCLQIVTEDVSDRPPSTDPASLEQVDFMVRAFQWSR